MTQLLNDIIFPLIVVYLASILLFSAYLKNHHNAVWQSLGSFGFLNWGIGNSLRIAGYVLFRGAHRELKDRDASRYVVGIRLLVFGIIAPLIVLLVWFRTHSKGLV
jgi:cytochrome c biogenesis protein CcdA